MDDPATAYCHRRLLGPYGPLAAVCSAAVGDPAAA
jgi:hypothetical protein